MICGCPPGWKGGGGGGSCVASVCLHPSTCGGTLLDGWLRHHLFASLLTEFRISGPGLCRGNHQGPQSHSSKRDKHGTGHHCCRNNPGRQLRADIESHWRRRLGSFLATAGAGPQGIPLLDICERQSSLPHQQALFRLFGTVLRLLEGDVRAAPQGCDQIVCLEITSYLEQGILHFFVAKAVGHPPLRACHSGNSITAVCRGARKARGERRNDTRATQALKQLPTLESRRKSILS